MLRPKPAGNLTQTRPEVDDNVEEEDGVGHAVEDDPVRAEVVVEERDGHGQDDEVGDEQHHHEQVPVESAHMEKQT
jgi:hypothetical protein